MKNAFAVISLIFTIFSVARFGSQCQSRKPVSYPAPTYKYTQWNNYIDKEKIKIPLIKNEADKYVNGLYPGTTFIIKDVVLLSNNDTATEAYQITAYIDDTATTDTIFYQYEMTVEKMDIVALLSQSNGDSKRIKANVIDCSGLKLKN